jgi:heme-degrading monooxygenase HmoA
MKRTFTYALLALVALFAAACNQSPTARLTSKTKKRKPVNYANYIVEIATYKTKKGVKEADFARLDSVIELIYTRKQPGYISKESGIDQQGNWLVVVSWDNKAHANSGFDQFMNNPLSANFKKMIDTASISHKLFSIKNDESNSLKDKKPYVIELATFRAKQQIQRDTFDKRDQEVDADYISRQSGYITRRIGIAEDGERLMMIYWQTLENADAGMKEFLKDNSVADYNKMIDWKTVDLKRFKAVN